MRNIFKISFTILSTILFLIILILSIIGGVILIKTNNAFLPLRDGYSQVEIFDKNNEKIQTDGIVYSYIPLTRISKNAINAFIASEDRSFYKHNGYNIKRILKAIKINIENNGYSSGASTITQQYVKNVYLSSNKTIKRKVNELAYAIELEKRYTKDQILEAYLNSILFGGSIFGINEASLYYFNHDASSLTYSEAAYLAGVIQAPNRLNAFKNPTLANERKNVVLKCMLEEKYISEEDYKTEINIEIATLLKNEAIKNTKSYLIQYLDYVMKNKSIFEASKIYTYLDQEFQQDLYEIAKDKYKLINDESLNLAIIGIDNETYGIKGLLTNRTITKKSLDYATEIRHQPGSTIKPILDYGPALEYYGFTPSTIIYDNEYTYSDGTKLKNYDNAYQGPITLRYALKDSRNIPALKVYQVVQEKSKIFAESLGVKIDKLYEADSIGGATNGYTILELANAYATFANLGKYKKASPIAKIKYTDYTFLNDKLPTQVIKPSTAWLINNILHDVFKDTSYDLTNTYLMAKSGQTNYDEQTRAKYGIPADATKDSLLMCYTKDLTIGIWVGYSTISKNKYLDREKKAIARNIMRILLSKYAKDNNYYDVIPEIKSCEIEIYNSTAYLSTNGFIEYYEKGTEPLSYAKKIYEI